MSSSETSKDIIKKSFETREGVYRISEYIEGQPRQQQQAGYGRPTFPQSGSDGNNPSAPVRISSSRLESPDSEENGDAIEHICFNHGRELHFMPFSMSKQNHTTESETTKMYKGTIPTCHDVLVPNSNNAHLLANSIRSKTEQAQQNFNSGGGSGNGNNNNNNSNNATANNVQNGAGNQPSSVSSNSNETSPQPRFFVLVGFGAGQIQLFEASKPQQYVFFNESRATDATRVSSIKWVPHSASKFLAAHASGHIYLYDTALPCDHQKPQFVQVKTPQFNSSNGNSSVISLYVNKNKNENPTHRLSFRTGCVNHFAFSQCGYYLALACQDGFLRVFRFGSELNSLELCVQVRSFFGGFTCVAWSPDGRYLATGGEDDLITLVSFHENRVVCRGRGHRSWITSVAFDNYACVCGNLPPSAYAIATTPSNNQQLLTTSTNNNNNKNNNNYNNSSNGSKNSPLLYRLASVGQDTLLCLWELTEDVLVTSQQQLIQRQRLRSRSSLLVSSSTGGGGGVGPLLSIFSPSGSIVNRANQPPVKQSATESSNILSIATSNSNDVVEPLNNPAASSGGSGQLNILQRSGSNSGRCTPSPSSTLGSASGTSLAGVLASKFAFWHRDKYKMGGSKKGHKKSKSEKRGSLTSTTSAITHLDHHGNGTHEHFPLAATVNSSSSSHQVRSSASDLAGTGSLAPNGNLQNGVVAPSSTPPLSSSPIISNGCSLLGTAACPRLGDVPVIDPLILKKVAADPLSGVAFLKECLLTACQAGYLAVWSRPTTTAVSSNGGSVKENSSANTIANGTTAASNSSWNKPIEKQASVTSSSGGGGSQQPQQEQQRHEVASSFL